MFSTPSTVLSNYIEFFSESIVNSDFFSVEMFPSWTPTIYINLGCDYQLSIAGKTFTVPSNIDVLVLRDFHTVRNNFPGDRIFTIKFVPGGLEAIFNISQLRFKGKMFLATEVLPPALIQQVRRAPDFEARTHIIGKYFLSRCKERNLNHYVTFVSDLINSYQSSQWQLNVNQLAEKHFTCSKTINRYFHRTIGASPKEYFSVLRARTALTAYISGYSVFDPAKFGFYDHSHFYKEAANFLGFPLKERPGGRDLGRQ